MNLPVLCCLLLLPAQAPTEDHTKGIETLCSDFVDALRQDDFVGYAHCWSSLGATRDLLNDPPEGMRAFMREFPKSRHAEVMKYALDRNKDIGRRYPKLRRKLLRINPDLSQMRLIAPHQ